MESLNHTLKNITFYDICPLPYGYCDTGSSYFIFPQLRVFMSQLWRVLPENGLLGLCMEMVSAEINMLKAQEN